MSFAEIKEEVDRLAPAEREKLRRYLALQTLQEDPEWLDEMDRRIDRVRAGHASTANDVERVHAARLNEGR
jgi:hypothetical protein